MSYVNNGRIGEVSYTKCGTPAIIKEYKDCKNVLVEFQDEYKYQYKTSYLNFKNGHLTNPYECRNTGGIGFIGVGKYNSKDHIEAYRRWKQIINRCLKFNKEDESIRSYEDCDICKEWLNFQNFAEWYYENLYEFDGTLCVDKDILVHGNRVYSPDTCLIVPERINLLFVKEKARRNGLPIGVTKMKSGKYTGMYHTSDGNQYFGCFNTVEECFNVYKNRKESYIKEVLKDYENIVPKKVYDAVYNYEILITD